FELVLELADVLFPVGEPLIAPRQLLELLLDLELLREDALLDLQHLRTPVGELGVDLAAQADGLLAGLDLGLAPHCIAFSARVVQQLIADSAGFGDSGGSEDRDREQGKGGASGDTDGNSDPDHCRLLGRGPSRLRRHVPSVAEPTRQLSEKPYLRQGWACRKLSFLMIRRPPSRRK